MSGSLSVVRGPSPEVGIGGAVICEIEFPYILRV
jgi:hypothetical protein